METLYTPQVVSKKARIEIIPLIDVVFFLLATFVLFTLSLKSIKSIEVPLPIGDVSREVLDDPTVYLQSTIAGKYRWKLGRDGAVELITKAEIAPRLTEANRRIDGLKVMVSGSEHTRFSLLVEALDEVRSAKITKVSIETDGREFAE